MHEAEARGLVAALKAAFPSSYVEQATFDLYTMELRRLDSVKAATEAVQDVIRSADRFPPLVRILERYGDYRHREAEERASTHGIGEGYTPAEPPPEILAFIDRVNLRGIEEKASPEAAISSLPELPPGHCDDCKQDSGHSPRWTFGKRSLCRACLYPRLRVRMKVGPGS